MRGRPDFGRPAIDFGNRLENINNAKHLLNKFNIRIEKSSNFYETPSWPNEYHPKYLNVAIKINTSLTIVELFRKIKLIEKMLGRKKGKKNSPRECDIDILDYDQKIIKKKLII